MVNKKNVRLRGLDIGTLLVGLDQTALVTRRSHVLRPGCENNTLLLLERVVVLCGFCFEPDSFRYSVGSVIFFYVMSVIDAVDGQFDDAEEDR